MPFAEIDRLARGSDFWDAPINDINRGLHKNHRKDQESNAGVSLVIGFPFPEEILGKIEDLKTTLESDLGSVDIAWRTKPEAFHCTVYGLLIPKDFRKAECPFTEVAKKKICDASRELLGTSIELKGLCILGRGAVCIRVSDSPTLTNVRRKIEAITGMSKLSFGGRTNKIVIGRVLPDMTEGEREMLRKACLQVQEFEVGQIEITPEHLKIVQYENEFLEKHSACENFLVT